MKYQYLQLGTNVHLQNKNHTKRSHNSIHIKKKVKIEERITPETTNLDEAGEIENDFVTLHQQNYHHAGAKKGMEHSGAGVLHGKQQKQKVKYKYVTSCCSNSRRCHYCKRSGKYRVIECNTCKTIRYCLKCIRRWHSGKAEGSFYEACPVCRNNCNCKSCSKHPELIGLHFKNLKKLEFVEDEKLQDSKFSQEKKLKYSKYIIRTLLPLLKRFNEEQRLEKDIEAQIQGLSVGEIKVQKVECMDDERINCNSCKTSIADFHRCCSYCSYELCLSCCKEFRNASFEGDEVVKNSIGDFGTEMSDEEDGNINFSDDGPCQTKKYRKVSEHSPIYTTVRTGMIPCPGMDGHCCGTMLLKCIYAENWVTGLYVKAEQIAKADTLRSLPESSLTVLNYDVLNMLRKAASREDSEDNYLYCPTAESIQSSDLKHFQRHLFKGEPMIINNVLKARRSVSWEPNVIWRACQDKIPVMNVIDCLSWSQVKIAPLHFFRGYRKGRFYPYGWPQLLKSNDWPNMNLFEERLPRHLAEYVGCLPFQEVTHPRSGYLNLVSKLRDKSFKLDLGPKTHIGYGISQELGVGDSVTKLQCGTADVVYVLVHTETVTLTAEQLLAIHKRKQELVAQGSREFSGNKERDKLQVEALQCQNYTGSDNKNVFEVSKLGTVKMLGNAEEVGNANSGRIRCRINNTRSCQRKEILDEGQNKRWPKRTLSSSTDVFQGCEDDEAGALWDIFRRQDVPQLKEYLQLHYREFTHINRSPLQQVFDPIHDQTFYFTMEHKRRLKEEYGIEPWTFTQKLGDAVIIPAGCPYQIRNLKSCVNVALAFVSPENASESLRLTEELRTLPSNHIAKEDRLEINKMILHAMSSAIEDFKNLSKLEADVLAKGMSSKGPANKAKGVNKSSLRMLDRAVETSCVSISRSDSKPDESLSTSSQNDQIDVEGVESTLHEIHSFSVPTPIQGPTRASKSIDNSCKNPSPTLAKEIWEDFINYPFKVFGNRDNEMRTMHAISELIENLPLSVNKKEAEVLMEHYNILSSILRERGNKEQLQQEMTDLDESDNLVDNLRSSEVKLKATYQKLERQKQELEAKMLKISEKMREESVRAAEMVSMAEDKRSNMETTRANLAKAESEIDSLISRSFAIRSQFRRLDHLPETNSHR